MDPITHSLAGGLIAHSVRFSKRRVFIFCILGVLPDVDVLFSSLGSWAFIFQHRGLSHSFFGVIGLAGLFSLLCRKWDVVDGEPFLVRMGYYSLPLLFHLFCDYLTSYGVPLLMPFSFQNFHGDVASGFNIIFILILGSGYLLMERWPLLKPRFVVAMWLGWAIYIPMMFGLKQKVAAQMDVPRSTVISGRVNPFKWSVVDDRSDSTTYQCFHVNILTGTSEHIRVPKPSDNILVTQSRKDPLVQEFLSECRWPTVRVIRVSSGWAVDWGHIIFSARGTVRAKVRVEIDHSGRITHSRRLFGFWEPFESKDNV